MTSALLADSLIGRQKQLENLRDWVADLVAGRGRAVLVEGEPGIGKSSLIRVARAEAESSDCQVFAASCDELSRAFPLRPLLDALDASTSASEQQQISEVLRGDAAPGNRIDLVAAAAERMLTLVDDFCAVAPVLLIIEDLHWADQATMMTLGRLARSVDQLPLLLVCSTRPVPQRKDLEALKRAVEPSARVRLRGLSAQEATALVSMGIGGPPGPRLLRLAAGAAGNPLYLTELVDALLRGNALTTEGGRLDVTDARIPVSLAAAIADRLEFLTPAVHEALRAAALLGTTFSVADLAVVSGRHVNALLPVLDEAILLGVLRDDGHVLSFRHPLIRDALYEEMPAAVRAAWHRDAARALAHDGAPANRVARQLLPAVEAYDAARAVDEWVVQWLTEASPQLVGQAPRVAIPLLRWATAGIPAGDPSHDLLTCRLADGLYRAGDPGFAAEIALSALSHVTRPDLVVDLHWTLTQCRALDGQSEESLRALQRALDAPEVGPKHRARLLVLTARAHRTLGRIDLAGRVAAQALSAATAAGDRWATGWALAVLTIVHGVRGETLRALPLYERALAVADGDPTLADLRLLLQINLSVALGDLDRYPAAIKAAEQVRQLADEAGNVVRLAQAQSALGELLFEVGRWDDALAEVDLVSDLAKDAAAVCVDNGVAAAIRLHRGDAGAVRNLAAAERHAARLGGRRVGALALARSLNHEQGKRLAEALATLMDELDDSVEETEEPGDLLADAVRLALELNNFTAAASITRRADAAAKDTDIPHRKALTCHCHGLVDGDPVQLGRAAEYYQQAGRVLPRAQALEAAGVALAESGDAAGARARFTEAFSLYTELGANWDLGRIQARFRAYGIRRGPHAEHRRSRHGWTSLTQTETKVAKLVAKGMSNPEIAAQMFLSRRTVQTHVSHILAKLDLHSRIDIAREVSRRDNGATTG